MIDEEASVDFFFHFFSLAPFYLSLLIFNFIIT